MGYNSNCHFQNCSFECCGISGNCPSYKVDCLHYYSDTYKTLPVFGIVIGSILGLLLIISIIIYCCRRGSK